MGFIDILGGDESPLVGTGQPGVGISDQEVNGAMYDQAMIPLPIIAAAGASGLPGQVIGGTDPDVMPPPMVEAYWNASEVTVTWSFSTPAGAFSGSLVAVRGGDATPTSAGQVWLDDWVLFSELDEIHRFTGADESAAEEEPEWSVDFSWIAWPRYAEEAGWFWLAQIEVQADYADPDDEESEDPGSVTWKMALASIADGSLDFLGLGGVTGSMVDPVGAVAFPGTVTVTVSGVFSQGEWEAGIGG